MIATDGFKADAVILLQYKQIILRFCEKYRT